MDSHLSTCTYNSHEHGIDILKYMQDLVDKKIFFQEHWLHCKQICFFDSNSSNVKAHTILGMSLNELLLERPY